MSGNATLADRHDDQRKQSGVPNFAEPSFPATGLSSLRDDACMAEAIDFDSSKDHFQRLQLQTQDLNRSSLDDLFSPSHQSLASNPRPKVLGEAKVYSARPRRAERASEPNNKDVLLTNAQVTNSQAGGQSGESTRLNSLISKEPDAFLQHHEQMLSKNDLPSNHEERDENKRLMESINRNLELSFAAHRAKQASALAKVLQDRKSCKGWIAGAFASSSRTQPVGIQLALGRQVSGFWTTSRPTSSAAKQRQRVIAAIQTVIDRRWPGQGLQVAAFGSSVTGLVTDSSDLDLVLLDPTRPHGVGTPDHLVRPAAEQVRMRDGLPDWYRVYNISDTIRDTNAFANVVAISGANVPIVKMVHKSSKLPADLNVNERFGLFNSRLISAYANLQPEIVRPLIFFLKHWFLARGLNDPSGKSGQMSFSSYTISLMAIQYLQVQGILPNLQDVRLVRSLSVPAAYLWSRPKQLRRRDNTPAQIIPAQKYDVTFATTSPIDHRKMIFDVTPDSENQCKEDVFDRKLGDLTIGFFQYFEKFAIREQVVSIANGAPVDLQTNSDRFDLENTSAEDYDSENGTLANPLQSLQLDGTKQEDDDAGIPASWENPALAKLIQPADWQRDEIVVQDPFINNRNTARNIKSRIIHQFEAELHRAILILEHAREDSDIQHPLISDLMIPTTIVPAVDYIEDAEDSARQSVSEDPSGPAMEKLLRDKEAEKQLEEEVVRTTTRSFKKNQKTRTKRSVQAQARELRKVKEQLQAQESAPSSEASAPESATQQPVKHSKSDISSESWMPPGASSSFSFTIPSPGRSL